MQQVEITITQIDGANHSFKFPRILLRDVIEGVVGNDLADKAMADFDVLGRYEFLSEPSDNPEDFPLSIKLETVQLPAGGRA